MSIADKLTQIAENTPKVYEAGKTEGIEQGKQAEYDAFWDSYQQNGERVSYDQGFAGVGWNKETFKPKYDIKPTSAYMFFRQSKFEGDLVEHLKDLGVSLDFSNTTNHLYLFNYATGITHIGVIDATKSSASVTFDNCFYGCSSLVTIDKLIFNKSTKTGEFSVNTFTGCSALENLALEGEIAHNGLDLHWSTKLSKESIINIMGALDRTEGRDETTITLSLDAVNKAFETSDGANDGAESSEFNNACASPRIANWNISLV